MLKTLKKSILTGLALGLFALPGSLLYARDFQEAGTIKAMDFDKKQDWNLAKVTLQDAVNVALKEIPGKAVDAELEAENGFLVYEIEIATPDKKITKVYIDAGNAKILSSEKED